MKKIYSLICLLLLVAGNSVFGQSNILTYTPTQGQSNVSVSTKLILTFDNSITEGLAGSVQIINTNDTSSPEQEYQISSFFGTDSEVEFGTNSITITLREDLSSSSDFYVLISANAITEFGGISDDNQWRFSTTSVSTDIVSYYPEQNALNISANTQLILSFNNNISEGLAGYLSIYDANSPSSPYQQYQISSAVGNGAGVEFENKDLKITLQSPLQPSTTYYVLIDATAIIDFSGISDPNQWRFTTSPPLIIDTYTPTQDATDVLTTQNLVLGFNQDIQFASTMVSGDHWIRIYNNISGNPEQNFRVSSDYKDPFLNITNDQFTISLRTDLATNTNYYVEIPSGIIEATNGTPFDGITNAPDNNWRFTTVAAPVWALYHPFTENISPTSVDFVGKTDQDGTYYYVVTDSPIAPTIPQIKNGQDHTGLDTDYASGTDAMTENGEFRDAIDISNHILYDAETIYYVYAVATDGASGLDSEIGETTFVTLERTAPVSTIDPSNGATDVSIASSITITYDEPVRMIGGTIIDNSNVGSLINIPGFSDYYVTIDASRTIITITPNTSFESGTSYTVIISPVEDYFGNAQSSSTTTSFTTSAYVVWNGSYVSDPTNWDEPDNWTGSLAAGMNARIPAGVSNMPVISTNTANFVNDLVIEADATLDIASSGSLTVTDAFVMQSSNSGANASFINNGTLTVTDSRNVEIQQSITSSPAKWYFLSSPVSGATQTNIGCIGTVYEYDIDNDTWPSYGANTSMTPAAGYKVYSTQNMSFSGNINNNASYSFNATRTSVNAGWNLAGNPYPCSIDWNALDIGTTGLTDGFWVWLNDSQQYGTYNGNAELGTNLSDIGASLIPSNHSFWIKVPLEETSGTLTIPSSARSHNSFTYLKSAAPVNNGVIRLVAQNGEQTDEAIIAFNNSAHDGIEAHDSEKRYASVYAKYFEIFTIVDDEDLSINSLFDLENNSTVDLGVKVPEDGTYTLKLKEIKNFNSKITLKLEDHSTSPSTIVDLTNDGCTLELSQGTIRDRFTLHINSEEIPTDIVDELENKTQIYSNSNTIYMNIENLTDANYTIYDLSGSVIKNGLLQSNTLNTVPTSAKGIVIVKIMSKEGTLSQKIFVK